MRGGKREEWGVGEDCRGLAFSPHEPRKAAVLTGTEGERKISDESVGEKLINCKTHAMEDLIMLRLRH